MVHRTDRCSAARHDLPVSCRSKSQSDSANVLSAVLVALAATVAGAEAPAGLPPANEQGLIFCPHMLEFSTPRLGPVNLQGRPLRLDQACSSSATPDVSTRQFANTDVDGMPRPKSIFIIRWQRKPYVLRIARNLGSNGLSVVSFWHSGPSLLTLGPSPRGVMGLYLTQKVGD